MHRSTSKEIAQQPEAVGASTAALVEQLPLRTRAVLDRLLAGQSEKQAAAHLGLSNCTLHDHVKTIYQHFGVTTRAELLAKFIHAPLPTDLLVVDVIRARQVHAGTITAHTIRYQTLKRTARVGAVAAAVAAPLILLVFMLQVGMKDGPHEPITQAAAPVTPVPFLHRLDLGPNASWVQVKEVDFGQVVEFEMEHGQAEVKVGPHIFIIDKDYRWVVATRGFMEIRPLEGSGELLRMRVIVHEQQW